MKTNGMILITATGFFALLGLMAAEYYTKHEAINAGLQQCVVDGAYVWQKDCK